MNVYTQITGTIDNIKAALIDAGQVDRFLFNALENTAQKAADLAVVATAANDKELRGILAGLKAFEAQLTAPVSACDLAGTGRGYVTDDSYL